MTTFCSRFERRGCESARFLLLTVIVVLSITLNISIGRADEPLRVAFVIGEDEYNMKVTLPAFAKNYLEPLGVKCMFIHADEQKPNLFPGLEKIDDADLLFVAVRRRPLPKDDMARIHKFLDSGMPLVGIRTACHAFANRGGQAKKNDNSNDLAEWPDFDVQALGGHYAGHFNNRDGTEVTVLPEAKSHPILSGISDPSFHSGGTLYKCGDLDGKTVTLLNGTTSDQGKSITQPVAWTHQYGKSRVFFTSLGHPDDFKLPAFNRLLVNAVYWAAAREPAKFDR
jgi:type 1 glutamine amidotransferase